MRLLREAKTWGKSKLPDKKISPPKMLRLALTQGRIYGRT